MMQFFQAIINIGNAELTPLKIRYRGQSNMKGNSDATLLSDLPPEYKGTFSNVKVWNGSSYIDLDTENDNFNQFPISEREGGFGCEITSAIDLANSTGRIVYFTKYAVGGSALSPDTNFRGDWSPSSTGELFDLSQDNEDLANQWLADNEITVQDIGEVWYQGESDANNIPESELYEDALRGYITARRNINGLLPFIVIQLDSTFSSGVAWNNVIAAQNIVAGDTNQVFLKGNDGEYERDLITEPSNAIHLTSQGQVDLGKDLAQFIITNIL